MKTLTASTIPACPAKTKFRANKPRRSTRLLACLLASFPLMPAAMAADKPLRVILSTDSPSVSESYANALAKAHADVVAIFEPDEASLAKADVVLLHRTQFRQLPPATLAALGGFAKKGGGIVAVNGAVAAGTADWGKATFGGGWDEANSRSFDSLMMLYVAGNAGPIVKGSSPFDIKDHTGYDLVLADDREFWSKIAISDFLEQIGSL